MNREYIQKFDAQNMLGSIEVFDKQCTDAWQATQELSLPDSYTNIDHVVFVGMGGSALGIDVIKTVFAGELTVPITVVGTYDLPAAITQNTLVIFSSYSGTTEEIVEAIEKVDGRTEKLFIITTGGDLERISKERNIPAYIFVPTFNPSNQPRMAVGYSVMGTIGVFVRLGLLSVAEEDVMAVATYLESLHAQWGADVDEDANLAKQVARSMNGTIPVYVSSEHLEGSVHVATNQLNENGKTFAARFILPELNHHLIEGLVYPKELISKLSFVFFESTLYHVRNQKRYRITEELATKQGIQVLRYEARGASRLEQALETIVFGAYVSFYTAMILEIDPSPIPNVDYLKEALNA